MFREDRYHSPIGHLPASETAQDGPKRPGLYIHSTFRRKRCFWGLGEQVMHSVRSWVGHGGYSLLAQVICHLRGLLL